MNAKRCEVLWSVNVNGKQVERWLPGERLNEPLDGRVHVRTDCGKETNDAAPECVRDLPARKSVTVFFEDGDHYSTSVNGGCTDDSIRAYFVGQKFDRGTVDVEKFKFCNRIEISTT